MLLVSFETLMAWVRELLARWSIAMRWAWRIVKSNLLLF